MRVVVYSENVHGGLEQVKVVYTKKGGGKREPPPVESAFHLGVPLDTLPLSLDHLKVTHLEFPQLFCLLFLFCHGYSANHPQKERVSNKGSES